MSAPHRVTPDAGFAVRCQRSSLLLRIQARGNDRPGESGRDHSTRHDIRAVPLGGREQTDQRRTRPVQPDARVQGVCGNGERRMTDSTNCVVPEERERLVVVGNGMAATRLVEELISGGYAGHIRVLGDEPVAPYNRILLSAVMRGTHSQSAITMREPIWYAENGIDLRLDSRVLEVDPKRREVMLVDGSGSATTGWCWRREASPPCRRSGGWCGWMGPCTPTYTRSGALPIATGCLPRFRAPGGPWSWAVGCGPPGRSRIEHPGRGNRSGRRCGSSLGQPGECYRRPGAAPGSGAARHGGLHGRPRGTADSWPDFDRGKAAAAAAE